MSPVAIRPALRTDLDHITRLETHCFAVPWSGPMIEQELGNLGSLVLVAADFDPGAELLGYLAIRHVPPEAELLRIATVPRARRNGLGTQLLRQALEKLAGLGVERCFLEVRSDNRPAIALYRRFGARLISRRAAYYRDGADALVYCLESSSAAAKSPCPTSMPMVW
jgi:ribosomal-protein-alanine N-acetyltransferase